MKKIINLFKVFANYCKTCYDELAHKTTWPTGRELTSAVIVLTASLVIALIVFVMDIIFKNLMGVVYPG